MTYVGLNQMLLLIYLAELFTASHETIIWAKKIKCQHTFNYDIMKTWIGMAIL